MNILEALHRMSSDLEPLKKHYGVRFDHEVLARIQRDIEIRDALKKAYEEIKK